MRDLVRVHGDEKTYRIGLEALKYPPTWSHRNRELKLVQEALEVK